jgi:uncharacterized membrane protein YbhN (UPF0104 family)
LFLFLSRRRFPGIRRLLIFSFVSALLYYVFSNIDLAKAAAMLRSVPLDAALSALACIAASQLVSAMRMRTYLSARGVTMGNREAIRLYFAAMFFNVCLPGGIGGDGYKCLHLARRHPISAGGAIASSLSERANGLCALLLFLYALLPFGTVPGIVGIGPGFAFAAVLFFAAGTLAAYRIGTALLLKERLRDSLRALPYSFAAQGLQLLAVLTIVRALPGEKSAALYADYGAVFCVSSVLSMLPFSVGGLGLRELTFFTAAKYVASITPEGGAVAASAFFLLHLPAALSGIYGWLRIRKQADISG